MRCITLALIGLVAAAPVYARPLTFTCNYVAYSDQDGVQKVKASEPFMLTFVVDAEADKAYMLGKLGASPVALVANGGDGFTLVEISDAGNVTSTTIHISGATVHSRSPIILGEIVPSQYYGRCAVK